MNVNETPPQTPDDQLPPNHWPKTFGKAAVKFLLVPAAIFFAIRWAVSGHDDKRRGAPPTPPTTE
jgi:hypothetical protein